MFPLSDEGRTITRWRPAPTGTSGVHDLLAADPALDWPSVQPPARPQTRLTVFRPSWAIWACLGVQSAVVRVDAVGTR